MHKRVAFNADEDADADIEENALEHGIEAAEQNSPQNVIKIPH